MTPPVRFHVGLIFMETEHEVPLCQAADQFGFDGAFFPDHIFYPKDLASPYFYTSEEDGKPTWGPETCWPDPWCMISACSSVTSRIRFTTGIYVAPARDLFTVAKLVSTAAYLSGDRVHLGIGAGWCEEEFKGTGQDFSNRGKRLNEMIPALRAIWTEKWAEFHGTYYDFAPLSMMPKPRKPVPIYLGGDTDVAMRRAVTLGDGWIGAGPYRPEIASKHVERIKWHLERARAAGECRGAAGRPGEEFPIYMGIFAHPDLEMFRSFAAQGVTDFIVAPWMSARVKDPSDLDALLSARIDACERFADEFIGKV